MTNSTAPWAEQLVVFDTETTGVSTETARIVSATAALIDSSGSARERYDWLIDPEVPIPEQAARVHGITTDIARANGMKAADAIGQILSRLRDYLARGFALVVYNAPYDLTLLKNEAHRHGHPFLTDLELVLDPLVIDKHVDRYRKGKRTLIAVAEHYGVSLELAHDAGADAIAAGQVMQRIATKYRTQLGDDVAALHHKQVEWCKQQAESFQEYMRRVNDPSFVAQGGWPVR